MKKRIKSIICIVLTVALIIGFAPSFSASEVEAAENSNTISAKYLNGKDYCEGQGWYYSGGNSPCLHISSSGVTLDMDESLSLDHIGVENDDASLVIEGNEELTVGRIYGYKLTINGANIKCGRITSYSTVTITNSTVSLPNKQGRLAAVNAVDYSDDLLSAKEGITLNNCSITKPSGGKVMKASRKYNGDYYNVSEVEDTYWTIRANADTPAETILIEPSSTPEDAKEETPAADNSSGGSSGGKKNYKNEWVDGQWYDANGKTDYKYKGSWKKDSIGWWYEDENGWFPTARWQKIDGDWYYFDDIGYMASNEYAGNWAAYSEGYWWVGEDGAWDGSEPGVWRLSGTKWWFKDSTGWFAKGKWYKIGGTWYEFDADGWWIEK